MVTLAVVDAGSDVLTMVEPLTAVVNTYGAFGMLPCEA